MRFTRNDREAATPRRGPAVREKERPASSGARQAAPSEQSRINSASWTGSSRWLARVYSSTELRPPEAAILERHRDALAGRVLELGCGTGRITTHLCAMAQETHGIDVAPAMLELCRRECPDAILELRDLRDLSSFEPGSFDAVFAGFNVLDVLDHAERLRTLAELHRILSPRGLLAFSSHNRASAQDMTRVWHVRHNPRQAARDLLFMPLRLRNHARMSRRESHARDHAILNDSANDFALLHYYVGRDDQERQLAEQGFALLECLDLDARPVPRGETAAACAELHYVALRSG